MYEGKGWNRKRRGKGRLWKGFCMGIMTLCMIGAYIALTGRLLPAKAFVMTQQETEPTEEAEIRNEAVSEPEYIEKEPEEPVIVLDPGHGGEDEGCASEGVWEKDVNLAIAKVVQGKLEMLGYQVIMTREDDSYIAKEDRVKLANESQADIYVSIHQNSSEDAGVSGMEVWFEGEDAQRDNQRLAQLIYKEAVQSTGAVERELCSDSELHVTRETSMPACLIETGFLTNTAECKELVTEEYQEKIAEGIAQGIELYFHPKTMYLTFDDGPSPENTYRVLDVLKERNIKATFFLVGENVRRYPEVVQRIVAEGHTIGIHSDSHNYNVIYESVDSFIEDFEAAHQTVLELTGIDAKLYRFPGGSINNFNRDVYEDIIEEMSARGYIYFDWNASLEDATAKPEPQQLIANGVETTFGRKKVVMLAHDVVYQTGICLDELLDRLPEYEMKPLTEDVVPIQF